MMIKVSAVLGISLVAVLMVSLWGFDQKEIIEPVASYNLLEDSPNGDIEQYMSLFEDNGQEILSVGDIDVYEEDGEVDLGFDVKEYLPMDFNPYSTIGDFNNSAIDDMALVAGQERTASLGSLDQARDYEPLNVGDIIVLENDDDIDLGFNVKDYLPRGFNPYASR